MKCRIAAVFLALVSIVAVSYALIVGNANQALINELGRVHTKNDTLSDILEDYQALEAERAENDQTVFLRDPHGFIERGIVDLKGEYIKHIRVIVNEDGARTGQLTYEIVNSQPVIEVPGGQSIRLSARDGETVHLMISTEAGESQPFISYYHCYTNNPNYCQTKIINTGIPSRVE